MSEAVYEWRACGRTHTRKDQKKEHKAFAVCESGARAARAHTRVCEEEAARACFYLKGVARVRVDRLDDDHYLEMRSCNVLAYQLTHLKQLRRRRKIARRGQYVLRASALCAAPHAARIGAADRRVVDGGRGRRPLARRLR